MHEKRRKGKRTKRRRVTSKGHEFLLRTQTVKKKSGMLHVFLFLRVKYTFCAPYSGITIIRPCCQQSPFTLLKRRETVKNTPGFQGNGYIPHQLTPYLYVSSRTVWGKLFLTTRAGSQNTKCQWINFKCYIYIYAVIMMKYRFFLYFQFIFIDLCIPG